MEWTEILPGLRKERGLSQAELAEELGLSRQAVSRWETGLAQPSAENLIGLSKIYGMTVEELYTYLNPPETEETEVTQETAPVEAPMEAAEPKTGPLCKYKRIMAVVLVVGIYLGTFLWGQVMKSPMTATGYLIWETIFLVIGWIIKFLWRKMKK